MCVVEQHDRAVPLRERDHLRHGRHVAVHAVDAVDCQQHAAVGARSVGELRVQRREVAVRKHEHVGAREPAAVDDRGVRERVRHHGVAPPDQRRDHAEVRRVSAAPGECGLRLEELGELLLERLVHGEISADQARAARRAADLARRARGRLNHLGMAREVEVVAAREQQHLAAVDAHARRLCALEHAHAAVGAARADLRERLDGDLGQPHC